MHHIAAQFTNFSESRIHHMVSSHRVECADLHRDYLRNLPSPFDIRYHTVY